MSQYINYTGMGGVLISDYAGLIGPLAQKVAQGINDLWYGKRIPDSVFKDPVASAKMKVIATSLTGLESRFKNYLKPYLPSDSWMPTAWLSSWGKSITLAISGGTAKSVYTQLKEFEKELSDIGSEWSAVTKLDKPSSTNVQDIDPEKGTPEKLVDFATTLGAYALIGIGAWYGGKVLYNYLEKKTRYPEDRLPRYAGGRRKTTSRRKSR
jgi:hypothetical protein